MTKWMDDLHSKKTNKKRAAQLHDLPAPCRTGGGVSTSNRILLRAASWYSRIITGEVLPPFWERAAAAAINRYGRSVGSNLPDQDMSIRSSSSIPYEFRVPTSSTV